MYCVSCQQYLCASCFKLHMKFKLAKAHKVIAIEGNIENSALLKRPPSFCNKHQEETLKLYCFDCKAAICMMCFVEVHKLHNCSNIDCVASELTDRLNDDLKQFGIL